ncbi:MAG TPA: glycosyltransferase family 2 protein [Solirubrobacteraceae bacterium]
MPPRVSVITPARDAAGTLPRLLDALAAQERVPDEVIVVDDGSADETRALAERHEIVTKVLTAEGRGPGAARNAGVAASTGEVLAFTDADCVPEPGWLRAGLAALQDADLVQGRVEADGPVGPFDRTVRVPRFSHLYETANLLLRRECFPGFEPWLSPARSKELAEDVWLGWRIRRAGGRVAFADDAVVRHAVERRDAVAFVAERMRLRYFPAMAARIPELRDEFFYKGLFLNRRTALFDLAAAGVAVAVARRRPLALAAVVPYARLRPTAMQVAADGVGLVALAVGSARARTLVL